MLIKMIDGGLLNYEDDSSYISGCPTCDYGSEYINEIDITLTKYKIHVETNQMYSYALSEGQMMKVLLPNYNTIQAMTEKEFIDWFKQKLEDTIDEDNYYKHEDSLEKFEVTEVK